MKKIIMLVIAAAMTVGFGAAALAGSCGGGEHKHADKCTCGYVKDSEECKKACASKDDSKEETKTEEAK
jgi:hypothetical protein